MAVIAKPNVLHDIMEIVRKHHAAVAAALYGRAAVTEQEWKDAVALGVVDDESEPVAGGLHEFGGWVAYSDAPEATHHTASETHAADAMKRSPRPPRTSVEKMAAQHALDQGAQYVRGLGNRVIARTGTIVINADDELAERLRGNIRDAVAANHGDKAAQARLNATKPGQPGFFNNAFRGTIKRVVSDIGHATKDWSRDIHRIAVTEGHDALQDGLADGMRERAKGKPALVFKVPRKDCCSHCEDLYLDGGVPRIFDLAHLQSNGTNVGRKAPDWRAVVGSVHPNCRCPLSRVPSLVTMPKGWRSGDAAPTVIGVGGRLIIP